MTDERDDSQSETPTNVISIYTAEPMERDEIALPAINEELVRNLEDLLAMAKSGELQTGAFHGSKLNDSGRPTTNVNLITNNLFDNIYFTIGALDALKMQFHRRLMEYDAEFEGYE